MRLLAASLIVLAAATPAVAKNTLVGDDEIMSPSSTPGDVLDLTLVYDDLTGPPEPVIDLDLHLLQPGADADGFLSQNEIVRNNNEGADVPEQVYDVASAPGDYLIFVVAFSTVGTQPQSWRAPCSPKSAGTEATASSSLQRRQHPRCQAS